MKKLFGICFVVFLLGLLLFLVFPNCFKSSKAVELQIKREYPILQEHFDVVLEKLSQYKKENGVYPDKIPLPEVVLLKSGMFDKIEYSLTNDKKGYWLKVYPKYGTIEFYYNDEHENGYNFYDGNGYYDGFLDNEFYYEIDKKWHAVKYEYLTRHSILF